MGVQKGKSSGRGFSRYVQLMVAAASAGFNSAVPLVCNGTVASASDVANLRHNLTACDELHVVWQGHVVLDSTIQVHNDTVLSVVGGTESAIIDGRGEVQLFRVSGGTLSITGLTLTKGATQLNITSSSISSLANGGAIYIDGDGTATMDTCTFRNNSAGYGGGAVFVYSSTATLDTCTFSNNSASSYGGGVFVYSSTATMDTCTFSDNSAYNGGGAVLVDSSTATMDTCTFSDNSANSASSYGGGVFVYSSTATMDTCTFSDNSAYNGGGIFSEGALLSLSHSTFLNNTAKYGGGLSSGSLATTLISDCLFAYNHAYGEGGGVEGNGLWLRISDSRFINNTAVGFGGGIVNNIESINGSTIKPNSNMTIESSTFVDNWSFSGAAALNQQFGVLYMEGCNMTSNTAWSDGGAVNNYLGIAYLTSCAFSGNKALLSAGGAVINRQIGDSQGLMMLMSCSFNANTAMSSSGGGVFASSKSITSILSCSFSNNYAKLHGGALHAMGTVVVSGGHFTRNSAGGIGGAICSEFSVADFSVSLSTFASNTATLNGGAIAGPSNYYTSSSSQHLNANEVSYKANVNSCVFERNSCGTNGGAVSGAYLQIFNSSFIRNSGQTGGAISGNTVLANICQFVNNSASNGGAVYSQSQLYGDGSTFTGNKASGSGGAVFMSGVPNWAWPTNMTQNGNNAGCCYSATPSTSQPCAAVDGQSEALDTCCPIGTWTNIYSCTPCSRGFDCGAVGLLTSTTPMDAGWWRGNQSVATATVCLNADACVGGELAWDENCKAGYHGPLCAVCDHNTAGIAYECHKCTSASTVASAIFLAMAVVVVVGITTYVVSDLHGSEALCVLQQPTSNMGIFWAKLQAAPFGKLRAPVVVLQIVTQYVAITGTKYPPLYQNFLKLIGVVGVNLHLIVSLGCVVHVGFYGYLLLVTITPLLTVGFLGLSLWIARRRLSRPGAAKVGPKRYVREAPDAVQLESRWERALGRHALVFMVLSFLIYSTVSTAVFQTFACDDLTGFGAKHYLRADYNITCSGKQYNRYVIYASFMVIVYPIGIPAVYAYMLWRHRSRFAKDVPAATRLADPSMKKMRFLWQPYKRQAFWWELAECVRRLFLTGFLVFILPGSIGQAEWACVFAVASLAAVFYFSPHESIMDAHLYCLGCIIIFCSMFFSVALQAETADNQTQGKQAVSVLLVVLNVGLIAATLVQCFIAAFQGTATLGEVSFYGLRTMGTAVAGRLPTRTLEDCIGGEEGVAPES